LKNNITPSLTALGTAVVLQQSPQILKVLKNQYSAYIRNVVIPLGAPLHKDGLEHVVDRQNSDFALFGKDLRIPILYWFAESQL
jgi:hypothetical protein